MIAVCNTSPISSLIQIGHLALLERLFTDLWIPSEVDLELGEGVDTEPSSAISQVAFILAKQPRSR